MPDRPKILTVDDKSQNLFTLEQTLQSLDVEICKAMTGSDALGLVLEHKFALAIVDVQMPEMDGYELAELLRGNPATTSLPIIFVSAIYSDEYHHRKGYDSGAVDFISKPFLPEILLSKVRVFIDLYEKSRNLQNLVDELNRTNATLSRRTMLLETSAKLGQQITSILDSKELFLKVASLIQIQFNFSSVSIWLVSDDENSIVLEARTKASVKIGTAIPIDHKGLVGQACRTGESVLDNKGTKNDSFVPTPGLSVIFSEIAVPLKFGRRILGALDIQSERFQAFYPDDEAALQLLSTQIAVAVRNARLYSEVLRLGIESQ
jgi:CheY-like chemotaxis protein/putative methionine-R-sulfoxide reductase with GAF domain